MTTRDPDAMVDLWTYDPEVPGWQLVDTGPHHQMRATANGAATRAAHDEDYRRAWVITDQGERPAAVIDRTDADVFHPFPDTPASAWSPLTGMKRPAPTGPALPLEPPVGTVIAWVNSHGYAQAAIRTGDTTWAISGREDDSPWVDLVDELTRDSTSWDSIGLVAQWAKLSTVSPAPNW